jgi:hypothetical protein
MFLKDIGAPMTPQNQTFLTAWLQGEGPSSLQYNNPFNTTGVFAGATGSRNSVGVQGYGTLAQGVQANANVLEQNHPGYSTLLNALRSGNVDPAVMAQDLANTPWGTGMNAANVLKQWGDKLPQGYEALAGYQGGQIQQNLPQIIGAAAQSQNIGNQQLLNQLLAGQSASFARTEAGFQNQNIGLSQQQLGIEEGALKRQFGLVPAEYHLQGQAFNLQSQSINRQRDDINAQFQQQLNNLISAGAGSGSLFTKGQRDTSKLMGQEHTRALQENTAQRSQLSLSEKGANLQFKEHMASLRDEQKNYNILAQRYGISKQEVQARLQNSLKELGYSSMSTASDLAASLVQAQIGGFSAANPAIPFGFPITGGLPTQATGQYPGG